MRRIGAVAVLVLLAGCHPHPNPNPTPSSSPSASPSASPSVSPSTSPSASPSVSPSASPSVTPSPSASPSPGGFPTAETAGVPAGTALTAAGTCSVGAGQTVTGKRFTCDRVEMGKGAKIVNSEVTGEVKGEQGFTIEHSTIRSGGCKGDAAIGNGNFTARYVELVGWGDGFRVEGGLGTTLIEHSYVKLCEERGFHGDGLQGYQAGSDVTLRHNTIDQPDGAQLDGVTGNVFWADNSGNRLTLEDNLLIGGGYTIGIHSGTGHVVRGNRIVPGRFGPVSCGAPATWTDNRRVTLGSNYTIASTGAEVRC